LAVLPTLTIRSAPTIYADQARFLRPRGRLKTRQPDTGGRIYQQTFVDTYAKLGFAKLYDRKTPVTAADLRNDRVIPFYEGHGIPFQRVLTDRPIPECDPRHTIPW
jgi:hypothetical protein